MSRRRSRSPSCSTGPQPEGPGPAKRPRREEPEIPAPHAETRDSLPSVVFLPAGCGLHLALPQGDLLLQPPPARIQQVSLHNHTPVLVHEAALGSLPQHVGQLNEDRSLSLDLDASLRAIQEQLPPDQDEENVEPAYMQMRIDPQEGSNTESCSEDASVSRLWSEGSSLDPSSWVHVLDPVLPETGPDSPLPPLPPSPSPGPQERPAPHSRSSPCRARRRLF